MLNVMESLELSSVYTYSLVAVVLTSLYLYASRNHDFWKKRGIKGPRPLPFFGNVMQTMMNSVSELDGRRAKKFGHIYGVYEGQTPTMVVSDPTALKGIYVKDFNIFSDRRSFRGLGDGVFSKFLVALQGDDWRRVRGTVSPTFTSGKMRKMFSLMSQCVDGLMENLSDADREKKEVDLKLLFGCLTTDIIANSCFATKTNTFKDPSDIFLKNATAFFQPSIVRRLLLIILPRFIHKGLGIPVVAPEPVEFFVNITKHLIKQRKEKGERRDDFLQLLIDAGERSEPDEDMHKVDAESHHLNEGKDEIEVDKKVFTGAKSMTEEEIIAQSVLFFVVGYETTGTLLSFAGYALARNPEVQERLHTELKAELENNNNSMHYDFVQKHQYLDAVISETLRMYPPAVRSERLASDDYQLDGSDIVVPKNTVVQIPIYVVHHDPDNYADPEKFQPERFLPENRDKIKSYTYIPFAAGPRNCIGMRFALLEAKLALARVVMNYKFVATPNTDETPKLKKGTGLFSAERLVVGVQKR